MPTYISMVSMSGNEPAEPGSVSDAISEGAPETRKLIESHGGTLHEVYLTMGAFDVLMVMEFPSTPRPVPRPCWPCASSLVGSPKPSRRSPRASGRRLPRASEWRPCHLT